MVSDLMTEAWNETLRGGLKSVQTKDCTLTDYFDCHRIPSGGKFYWEDLTFQTVQTIHVVSGFSFRNSYGLIITKKLNNDESRKIFITTDTQFAPKQLMDFYQESDTIIHDCETGNFQSGVHAHYDELVTLPEETKAKMYLYHYQPNPTQDAEADGFRGFLRKGDIIDSVGIVEKVA